MLLELEIKDFALVEHVRVPFAWGLNVLTGETGAGKSIIMDALNVVLGGKAGPSLIRPQTERAVIEASFKLNPEISAWLKQQDLLNEEDDSFTCSREINKNGSKIRINGALVNLTLLQELRQKLLTVHAQHESRTLLSPQSQLEMLDALGDADQKKMLSRLKTLYARRKQLDAELAEINRSESERERRLDFARFQLAELEEAQLEEADEDEQVNSQRKVLANVSELESLLSNAQACLRGGEREAESGALDLIQKAVSELSKAAALDSRLSELENALNESLERIDDECRAIRKYSEQLDSDPETLSGLDERAAVLAAVKRKYGPELKDAIERQQSLAAEIEDLNNAQNTIDELSAELKSVSAELLEQALELSKKRIKLAALLSKKIHAELSDLGMSNCRFEISLSQNADLEDSAKLLESIGPSGLDKAEFLICPNPGQPMLPVAKIASGGELSRVMLAVKTIFAGAEKVEVEFFDGSVSEADVTGVQP
ncbi:MAG: AAA family ATPase, partial [Candidatus Obscuribacterales bacterium]|nr:AAA family ATPase [Candidatus Obscuribacterales bacterium]